MRTHVEGTIEQDLFCPIDPVCQTPTCKADTLWSKRRYGLIQIHGMRRKRAIAMVAHREPGSNKQQDAEVTEQEIEGQGAQGLTAKTHRRCMHRGFSSSITCSYDCAIDARSGAPGEDIHQHFGMGFAGFNEQAASYTCGGANAGWSLGQVSTELSV